MEEVENVTESGREGVLVRSEGIICEGGVVGWAL